MNKYGQQAWRHWQTHLPQDLSQLPNPQTYFQQLGETAAQEVEALTDHLAGTDPAGEDYLAKVGRLSMARQQAEEIVLSERILISPGPDAAGSN